MTVKQPESEYALMVYSVSGVSPATVTDEVPEETDTHGKAVPAPYHHPVVQLPMVSTAVVAVMLETVSVMG